MTKCGIAFVISIGLLVSSLLPSSAWAVSRGASCRPNPRAENHSAGITLLCWGTQDPWQDCGEDPWQLSSEVSLGDTFSDPWQDSQDPWQPFVTDSIEKRPARPRSHAAQDPWRTMQVRVVKISNAISVCDAVEDPWQPTFADPWQDDMEDPWQ